MKFHLEFHTHFTTESQPFYKATSTLQIEQKFHVHQALERVQSREIFYNSSLQSVLHHNSVEIAERKRRITTISPPSWIDNQTHTYHWFGIEEEDKWFRNRKKIIPARNRNVNPATLFTSICASTIIGGIELVSFLILNCDDDDWKLMNTSIEDGRQIHGINLRSLKTRRRESVGVRQLISADGLIALWRSYRRKNFGRFVSTEEFRDKRGLACSILYCTKWTRFPPVRFQALAVGPKA